MTTLMSSGFGGASDPAAATAEALQGAQEGLRGAKPDIAFVYCSTDYDGAVVLGVARAQLGPAPIVGGNIAGGYTERGFGESGVFVLLLSSDHIEVTARLAQGLLGGQAINAVMQDLPPAGAKEQLLFLLTDGLRNSGEETTLLVSSLFGGETTVAGAINAASDDSPQRVFFNDQIAKDAAAITLLSSSTPFFSSVRHGHSSVSAAVTVTRAEGTRIYTLDDKPAWTVWKELTRRAAAQRGFDVDKLSPEAELHFRMNFELGLRTGAKSLKARFITDVHEDGSIELVAPIPPAAQVYALDGGDHETQLGASRAAAEDVAAAARAAGYQDFAGAMVVECAVRQSLLGEDFHKASTALSSVLGDIPLLAVEAYGELLLKPEDFTGYHNASTVVILFVNPRQDTVSLSDLHYEQPPPAQGADHA